MEYRDFYDDSNHLAEVFIVAQDITSFKKAQLELELSKQKIETSLDLLAKSEYSKNEASKVAKIGFLEDDIATDTFIWSDYVYFIFGFDKKSGAPSREEVVKLFDAESQKRIKKATLNLDLRGVSSDLELRLINLKMKTLLLRILSENFCMHQVYLNPHFHQDQLESEQIHLVLNHFLYDNHKFVNFLHEFLDFQLSKLVNHDI